MDDDAKLEEADGHEWEGVVECARLLVLLDQEGLIDPVYYEVVETGYGIKNWHATCVGENRPQRCKILRINEVGFDFLAGIKLFHILLDVLSGIDLITILGFEDAPFAASVEASKERLEDCVADLGSMGSDRVHEKSEAESGTDVSVPSNGEIAILPIKDSKRLQESKISVKVG